MSCLEFHRQCLIDPDRIDQYLMKHTRSCKSCAEFYLEVRSFDKKLAAVIKCDTPENLKSDILLRQSLQDHGKQYFNTYFALAASLLIAVATTLMFSWQKQDAGLNELVIAYVEGVHADNYANANIGYDTVAGVLQPLGMMLKSDFGPVQAARPCLIRGNDAAHLVVAGDQGTVDIIYMPFEDIDKRIEVTRHNNRLILIPCPKGSLAIVGSKDERLATIESRFHAASVWL
jgi:hypothetical protein